MDIHEDRSADLVVLTLSGRLDGTTTQTFEEKILGVIDGGAHRLVVDLAQLEYVSSAGLRVFLHAAKRIQRHKGKLALCSLAVHVQQVFDLSGFSSILAIYGSRPEAVDRL